MLKPKKKITKKELKQDKFVIFTLQAKKYFDEHQKAILQAGIGIIILIILITFYVNSKRSAAEKASSFLGQAQIELQMGNQDRAITLLKELVDRYEGTVPAGQGTFMLARIYWQNGDYTNAKEYFKKYIDDYANDPILTPAAFAGYADYLLIEKKYAEAAQYYEKAAKANPEFPEAASFLYSAAIAYRDAGDVKKAKEIVEKILKDYSDTQYRSRAELLLAMLDYEG